MAYQVEHSGNETVSYEQTTSPTQVPPPADHMTTVCARLKPLSASQPLEKPSELRLTTLRAESFWFGDS